MVPLESEEILMSANEYIIRYTEGYRRDLDLQIREIFFQPPARNNFKDDQEKESFFQRWTRTYFRYYPEYIYCYMQDQKVLGYLMGCPLSSKEEEFTQNIPGYAVFAHLFRDFEAHYHINCRVEARGKGVGKKLTKRFESDLKSLSDPRIKGMHVVTAPQAENVKFYKKIGHSFAQYGHYKDRELLFLGRPLQ